MNGIPTIDDIQQVAQRIKPYLHRTPIMTSAAIDEITGGQIYFKCENFQKVGAFKARGALNAVLGLDEEHIAKGVATHSSGNHAAALAMAAGIRSMPAYIVMPDNAPEVKRQAVRSYGANITYCAPTLEARENTLIEVVNKTGASLVHPFDDFRIIAGQATAALELFEDVPDIDIIMAPVGGGGLISGTALSKEYFSPSSKVIGAEPQGADDAKRSFDAGYLTPSVNPASIADGLLTSLCERTFNIIKQYVSNIVTVDDVAIIAATRLIMERMKIVVEPSAAVTLAAVLEKRIDISGKRVGIILSGGNIDMNSFISTASDIVEQKR
jgi:threonine dehydratase